jgi:heptosyltransferase III
MNFLLIRTGGLGDCVLTLPVGSYLKGLYPEAQIHVLGNAAMLGVAGLTREYSGFRSIDEAGFSALFSGSGTTGFLRDYFSAFDKVYFYTAGKTESLLRTMLDAGAGECRVLDPRPPQGFKKHITEHLLSILEAPPDFSQCPFLPIIPSPVKRDTATLVIHPGSGGVLKMWPLERFIEIASLWPDQEKVIFLLGPVEIEHGLSSRIPDKFRKVMPSTIQKAFHILAGASLYLGNDSGVSHLASLAGTPSVVLFGPSDPKIWKPVGSHVYVLTSPDRRMDSVEVAEVLCAIHNLER